MLPDVRQQRLDRLFQTATAVEVCDRVLNVEQRTVERRTLVRFSEPAELAQLACWLRLQHRGNPSQTFSLGEIELVCEPSGQQMTLQRDFFGLTLRADGLWRYDAPLADGAGLSRYLKQQGCPVPWDDHLVSEPFPFLPELADWELAPVPSPDGVSWSLEHLRQRFPDDVELAEQLLVWSAPNSALWDRYPGIREHMRKLLRRLPVQALVKALGNPDTQAGARVLADEWGDMPNGVRRWIKRSS